MPQNFNPTLLLNVENLKSLINTPFQFVPFLVAQRFIARQAVATWNVTKPHNFD